MMRLAAAAVIFLCSIAAVSAQEPTGAPSDQSAQRTCVFAGENYSEGAEFCVASHAGLKCESGKWSRDTQLECGGEVGEQHTMPYHGTDEHMMTDHMDPRCRISRRRPAAHITGNNSEETQVQ